MSSHGLVGQSCHRQEYDLTKWVQQGKLLWVDPVSEDNLVRGPVEAFPYARITGRRHPYAIKEGQVHDLSNSVGGLEIEEWDLYR